MSGWWVHELWNSGQRVELIAWIFWVIAAITLHELAHGWAALWEGDPSRRLPALCGGKVRERFDLEPAAALGQRQRHRQLGRE